MYVLIAHRCMGLAAFTMGYCFGRVRGGSEAERAREKHMFALEKALQARSYFILMISGCITDDEALLAVPAGERVAAAVAGADAF